MFILNQLQGLNEFCESHPILEHLIIDTRYLTPENYYSSSDDEYNASDDEADEDYATESAEWGYLISKFSSFAVLGHPKVYYLFIQFQS